MFSSFTLGPSNLPSGTGLSHCAFKKALSPKASCDQIKVLQVLRHLPLYLQVKNQGLPESHHLPAELTYWKDFEYLKTACILSVPTPVGTTLGVACLPEPYSQLRAANKSQVSQTSLLASLRVSQTPGPCFGTAKLWYIYIKQIY